MKGNMHTIVHNGLHDEFYTPQCAVLPLIPYIKQGTKVLCPFDGDESEIVKVLRDRGCVVQCQTLLEGKDFFGIMPSYANQFDLIVSNPPYSIKDKVLGHLYFLGVPFAILSPLTTLEGKYRGGLFQTNGLQLLVIDTRINFMENKKGNWFNTSWFCWKLLPKDLIFVSISKDDVKSGKSANINVEQIKLF